jgi:hypothetical protein
MKTLPDDGPPLDPNRRDSFRSGEDTLRLIAHLPAPEGLAVRVKAGLRTAPSAGRILMWRGALIPARGWMYTSLARGVAAAAIVCVVAGGGWRIYSHVQPGPSANVIALPTPGSPAGSGFSSSKATRLPGTLDRPVLTNPAAPSLDLNVVQKMPAQPRAVPRKARRSASRQTVVPPR